jgi:ABC-2 type transport system permease protein
MLAVAAVALRRYLRERSNVFFVFVLPLMIIFLVGFSFGSESGSDLGVVAGRGAGQAVSDRVIALLPPDQVVRYDDRDEALLAVERNAVAAAAVFADDPTGPVEFIARAGNGLDARAELEQAVAAANQREAVVRQAALVGVSEAEAVTALEALTVTPVETERVGDALWEGLSGFDASALTQVILFTFLSALTSSAFLIQDRQLGMARRKASAPVSSGRILLGETIGRYWISMFQAALIVVVTAVAFRVDWGDPLATGLLLVLFVLVSTGAGILLGSAIDNAEAASGLGIMLGLVLGALGGAMAPVEIFPPAMQTVARATPHYWAIEGLKISVAGGGLDRITTPLAVLAGTAVGLLAVSLPLYRRQVLAS